LSLSSDSTQEQGPDATKSPLASLARPLRYVALDMGNEQPARSIGVTIIADNRETLDGLHAYLRGAGIEARTTRVLADATASALVTTSLVLFPDDYDTVEVVTRVSALRQSRPELLVVVITSASQRFRPAFDPDNQSLVPVVLPKPTFGWTILDTIREYSSVEPPS
jgi:hypothetical protein